MRLLWGQDPDDVSINADALGSVIACDFYWAGASASPSPPFIIIPASNFLPSFCQHAPPAPPAVIPLSDAAIVSLLMTELLTAAISAELGSATAIDSFVLRMPGAVTHFSPGSFPSRPSTLPEPTALPWLACAGDWVRLGEREHGAKGLCQERALVTGYEAANALLRGHLTVLRARSGGNGSGGGGVGRTPFALHPVRPVRADEPQVVAGRAAARALAAAAAALRLPASPWAR